MTSTSSSGLMPLGKVKRGGKNLTARFPSLKMTRMITCTSPIQLDCVYYLDYELDVDYFEERPGAIEYVFQGQKHRYTPDFHVVTRNGQHWLIECKSAQRVTDPDNLRNATAATLWCESRFWRFRTLTDQMLRTGWRLENIKLLTQYARHEIAPQIKGRIAAILAHPSPPPTISALSLEFSPENPAVVIAPILHMAYHHEISIDLDTSPITGDTFVGLARLASIWSLLQ